MARAVVSSSVGPLGPLLEKLNALHAGEYGRMRGVRTLIGSLRSELTNMYAAVKDYDPAMLEEQAVEVKTWISLLRELAYDTEYCIDKFIHQLGSGGRHGGFKEFFRKAARNLKTLLSLRGIADQIDQLKVRIKQVKDLKNSSKLDDTLCSTNIHTAVDPRLRDFFAEDAHLVGMGGPRNDIIRLMMAASDSSQGTRVLSIVGFGGLGKTALANQVYRKIKSQYDFCAFVSVSQKPDVKSIIKDVMYKLGYIEDTDIWDEMRYIEELRELLKDKRYLIIIDDLWSTEAWNVIKHAFPWNKLSSRIITTTRIVDVAQSCCSSTNDCIYVMEPLAVDDARKLFMKRIFGYEDWCLNELQEVSHEILKKCGGLPLAIISISGLLANKPFVKDEWEKVKRSIGQLGRKQSLDQMNNIISLSYDELPPNLKTCLLYLSIFPEGFVIERERLVRLWIAERFIPEEHGRSQQEVAENYFYELINKNTVQPVDIGYDGKARACRVHHMMLALIYSKSVEDNFITMVGVGRTGLPNRHCLIRRLAVQRTDQELVSALESEDLSHVRSLIVTSSVCIEQLPSLDKFEALRVLDFEDCKGLEDHIINNLGKLFKLKYLNLSGTGISKLPLEIVLLHDLEVLDLRGTRIKELPAEIIQLTKIQHLLISSETWTQKGEIKIPDGIGNMVDLCVMSGFNVTESSADAVGELGHLITLRELHIKLNHGGSEQYKKQEEMLLSSLCKLGKLKSLRIHKCHGSLEFLDSWSPLPSSLETFRLSGDFCFMNIPKWISPELTNLAYLEISLTELRGNDLHTLGELPTLHYLYLSFVADPVKLITVQGTTGFKCLERFAIYSVAGSYITFSEGAMPKLEKLNVRLHVALAKNCGFYLGIQHLPCLKEAVVSFYEVAVAPFKIKAAAAAIRKEARVHPNHPTIDISGQFSENHSEISSDEEDLR